MRRLAHECLHVLDLTGAAGRGLSLLRRRPAVRLAYRRPGHRRPGSTEGESPPLIDQALQRFDHMLAPGGSNFCFSRRMQLIAIR